MISKGGADGALFLCLASAAQKAGTHETGGSYHPNDARTSARCRDGHCTVNKKKATSSAAEKRGHLHHRKARLLLLQNTRYKISSYELTFPPTKLLHTSTTGFLFSFSPLPVSVQLPAPPCRAVRFGLRPRALSLHRAAHPLRHGLPYTAV